MSHFDHDYAVFDEYGLARLLCQRCGTVIKDRTYIDVPSKLDATKTIKVLTLAKNSSYREVWLKLSDGGNVILKVCKGCEKIPISSECGNKIILQFRRAGDKELEFNPLPPKEAKKLKERLVGVSILGMTPDDEILDISGIKKKG